MKFTILLIGLLLAVVVENGSASKEQRLRQIQRRRKELEVKYAKQMQKIEENQQVQEQPEIQESKTQLKQIEQIDKYHKVLSQKIDADFHLKNFIFETSGQMDEFVFHIPVAQTIGITVRIYVLDQNQYRPVKDIETEAPVRIYIYEDNHKIIKQQELFFRGAMIFEAKEDSMYTIRFYNAGKIKLIEGTHSAVVQTRHVQKLLSNDEGLKHANKARELLKDFFRIMNDVKIHDVFTITNGNEFNNKVSYYYIYQVVELAICLSVCFTQLSMIKKLLKGQSIV